MIKIPCSELSPGGAELVDYIFGQDHSLKVFDKHDFKRKTFLSQQDGSSQSKWAKIDSHNGYTNSKLHKPNLVKVKGFHTKEKLFGIKMTTCTWFCNKVVKFDSEYWLISEMLSYFVLEHFLG